MEGLLKFLYDQVMSQVHPYMRVALSYSFVLFLLGLFGIVLWKACTGNISFLGLQFRTASGQAQALKTAILDAEASIAKLSRDSRKKSVALVAIRDILGELTRMGQAPDEAERARLRDSVYKLVVSGVSHIISHEAGKFRRLAIMIPDGDPPGLRMQWGEGFSAGGTEHFRAAIPESFAGAVFASNSEAYSPNVTKDPTYRLNPKATKHYMTLCCLPIRVRGRPVAVLSVDGEEEDAFNEEDRTYLRLFADLIGLGFEVEARTEGKGRIHEG